MADPLLIVGLTIAVIVIVIVVRVLTGRGWSNLSSKKKTEQPEASGAQAFRS